MTVPARAALVVLAAVVIAGLAVALREAHLESSGAAVVTGPASGLTPARVARAERDLRRADALTPHRDPRYLRARLLLRTGRAAEAERVLSSLVRQEPENATYWVALARSARAVDPAVAARARARVRQLSPVGTPG